jgi:hypothetical protein
MNSSSALIRVDPWAGFWGFALASSPIFECSVVAICDHLLFLDLGQRKKVGHETEYPTE